MNYREMGKTQLAKECDEQGITYNSIDTKMNLILKLEKANGIEHTEVKVEKRMHKVFGEYIKVRIHPQVPQERNNVIYLGINKFSWNIRPRSEVWLPIGVVDFAKSCTYATHAWDATAKGETEDQHGGHVTEHNPKYVIEILD